MLPNADRCFINYFCLLKNAVYSLSVDKLFTHYFQNMSSAYGGFAPRSPPGRRSWTPLGNFPLPSNLPTPVKKIMRRPCQFNSRLLLAAAVLHFGCLRKRRRFCILNLWSSYTLPSLPRYCYLLLTYFRKILTFL